MKHENSDLKELNYVLIPKNLFYDFIILYENNKKSLLIDLIYCLYNYTNGFDVEIDNDELNKIFIKHIGSIDNNCMNYFRKIYNK